MKLQIGTILIAKVNCAMTNGSGNALIVGKEYPIKELKGVNGYDNIIIESELDKTHYFDIGEYNPGYYGRYFDVKL